MQPEGESGIHSAVKNADIPMILILLDLGASIDRRDHQGNGYIYLWHYVFVTSNKSLRGLGDVTYNIYNIYSIKCANHHLLKTNLQIYRLLNFFKEPW